MTKREVQMIVLIAIIMMVQIITFCVAKADTPFVCAVTKGEWVWLRATPSSEGEKIGTIRYGVEGEIHEISNLYARITTSDGREGWCAVQFLLIPIKEEVWTVKTKDPVNVREKPPEYPESKLRYLGRLSSGTRVSVLGWRYDFEGNLWAHVFHGGYVKACFLSKAD